MLAPRIQYAGSAFHWCSRVVQHHCCGGSCLVHTKKHLCAAGTSMGVALERQFFSLHCWKKAFLKINTSLLRTACELLQGKTQNGVKADLIEGEIEAAPYPDQPCQVQFLLS